MSTLGGTSIPFFTCDWLTSALTPMRIHLCDRTSAPRRSLFAYRISRQSFGEVLFGVAIVALWLAACGGCGTSGSNTVAVQGRITYDSQPVTEGNVVFENAAHGWLRAAPLDSKGEF